MNRALINLDLSFNKLGPGGAAAIGYALKVTFGAVFDTAWMSACGLFMQVNRTLTSLKLAFNNLDSADAVALAEALKVGGGVLLSMATRVS